MVVVRFILLFLPYLLIPLFLVYLAKRRALFPIGFTYLITFFFDISISFFIILDRSNSKSKKYKVF